MVKVCMVCGKPSTMELTFSDGTKEYYCDEDGKPKFQEALKEEVGHE